VFACVALVVATVPASADPARDPTRDAIEQRFAKDGKAQVLALALFDETGDVVVEGPEETMDGGYRGEIHLVPALPIGGARDHLAWTVDALRGFDRFIAALYNDVDAKPAYRWHQLELRFVRSVGKRTPSMFTAGFTITHNLEGSLLTSDGGVASTLWHEIFHSNDQAHGDWSRKALGADYEQIVARCGTKKACLAPFAPNDTVVRGGTFYAFQPNNGDGVREYAAELAVRYFDEQRAMLAHGKLGRGAFKCGPAENARAWRALVDEFFAGRDLVPTCR